MTTVLIVIALVVAFILARLVIPQWLIRRAIRQVTEIFREHYATTDLTAKTHEELHLKREDGSAWVLFGRKDYKKYALTLLIDAGFVQELEDGRLYLLEEKLWQSEA